MSDYEYEERVAICHIDGNLPLFVALDIAEKERQARNERVRVPDSPVRVVRKEHHDDGR